MTSRLRRFLPALAAAVLCLPCFAQKQEKRDSLVRLMSAKSVRLLEIDGQSFREAIDANFLHNDTYLICDTAMWNVSTNIINAYGNVKIMQEDTQLTSDRMNYLVDDDMAEFRGHLVQLLDKDGNTLRTRHLDYNTKDSVAVFNNGGAMRDKDGQIMESVKGTYDSRSKVFTFEHDVNMYTDSVFIKTSRLVYQADSSMAYFEGGIDAWKDHDMLSSSQGWYNKDEEQFLFDTNVHGMSTTQEIWCDSLYYWRLLEDVRMIGNAQVTDTTRGVSAMAEEMYYRDSISTIVMDRNATVAAESDDHGKKDTVYVSADKIVYRDVMKYLLPDSALKASEKRIAELNVDPVNEYRRKAAEEASKAAEEAAKNDPNNAEAAERKRREREAAAAAAAASEEFSPPAAPADTLSLSPLDSLAVDVVAPTIDSTKIGFLSAKGRVKVFRTDMQAVCDSLEYTDLDSLARLYIEPIVWNETNRQYRSDSLTVIIKNKKMDRASLMSNAFIVIREDSLCFDQIKGAEIMAYFDDETSLRRFDALGGANAIFYLKENDEFATVNKVESKMLSAKFTDGEIDTIYYFDNPKNDAYPVVQFPKEEREMKGFSWLPERRPMGRQDITSLELRPSERRRYSARKRPAFSFTERYFPGHMKEIYSELARVDSLRHVRQTMQDIPEDSLAVDMVIDRRDSLVVLVDSLVAASCSDSLGVIKDSLNVVRDTLNVVRDTLEVKLDEKALRRQERIAAREARWAAKDAKDAEKKAEAQLRADKKRRESTYKTLKRLEKRAAKEQKQLDRYVERYRRKRSRLLGKQADDVQDNL